MGVRRNGSTAGRPPNFVDPITIGFDRLQIILQGFAKRAVERVAWLAPCGVAISLATTLVVSDFKDKFGLEAKEWRLLTIVLLVFFLAWSVWAGVLALKWQSLEDLMNDIAGESLAPTRNYALTIFRSRDQAGTNYLLVYFDEAWQCFLCPFVSQQPGQSDPDNVSEPAADRFGLPKQALVAREVEGLETRSHKRSEASHNLTSYRFTFYWMAVVPAYQHEFIERQFVIQERLYQWMTVEQLFSHAASVEKNGDVFRYIRDHRHVLFGAKAPLSVSASIGDVA